MFVCQYVHKFEVEKKDGGNPVVDGSVGLDVRVAEHTFYVACIYLDDEVLDTDEVKARGLECAEKTVELKLGLRVSQFAFVPCYGAEASRAVVSVGGILYEDPAYTTDRQIDQKINSAVSGVVYGCKSRRLDNSSLEQVHGLLVFVLPCEQCALAHEVDEGARD